MEVFFVNHIYMFIALAWKFVVLRYMNCNRFLKLTINTMWVCCTT